MVRLTSILFFAFPMLVAADDQFPQPDYQRQPSDPPWLASVVQFHGHLGPAVVAGARMGMIGLRAVEAKGYFDVEVTCEGPLAKPPQSCFLDGVQVATGATLGKRSLQWVQADQILDAEWRRKGIGSALMRELERLAAERNCGYVVFVTEVERTDAQRFYESLDYKPDAYRGFKKRLRKLEQ